MNWVSFGWGILAGWAWLAGALAAAVLLGRQLRKHPAPGPAAGPPVSHAAAPVPGPGERELRQ